MMDLYTDFKIQRVEIRSICTKVQKTAPRLIYMANVERPSDTINFIETNISLSQKCIISYSVITVDF